MISATVYNRTAEVKVGGLNHAEFDKDMMIFKNSIDEKDRKYVSHKKIWVVTNLEKYIKVPFIRVALLDRKKQLSLF